MKNKVGGTRLALEVINKAVEDYTKQTKTAEGRINREDARKFLAGEGSGHKRALAAWCETAGVDVDCLQRAHKVGRYTEHE